MALVLAGPAAAAGFDAATATNQLGLDLYWQLAGASPGGNLAISPYSIESALALAYAGAGGTTRVEMGRVLHFPEEDQPVREGFAAVRGSLDQIASDSSERERRLEEWGGKGDVIDWHAANRIFGQQGYDFRSSFIELLKAGYDAPFETANFRDHAEQERLRINGWVEQETKRKILNLIPDGGVNPGTRLVLVNALYLKAPWENPFKDAETRDLPFYAGGTNVVTVPTMQSKLARGLGYLKEPGFAAVAVPFQGGKLQMLIFLPDDREGLDKMTGRITPDLMCACAALRPAQPIDLYLPRFRLVGSTIRLGDALESLGMKSAFDRPAGSANFDRIAPRKPDEYLAISEVFHQTFIAVDEQGTEASAATAVAVLMMGMVPATPPQPIEFRVDHPFFFAIQERSTGICLFLGSVSDPR